MKAFATLVVAVCVVASLAGCGAPPVRDANAEELARATAARTVNDTAVRVAVSKPGQKVCRLLTVGISERDWIRGVVFAVEGDRVLIKIDQVGRFPQTLDGVALAPGALIRDTPLNWTPCA